MPQMRSTIGDDRSSQYASDALHYWRLRSLPWILLDYDDNDDDDDDDDKDDDDDNDGDDDQA